MPPTIPRDVRMVMRVSRLSGVIAVAMAVMAMVVSCGGDDVTAVVVQIQAGGLSRPYTATLEWLGPEGSLLPPQQVPPLGTFHLRRRNLASVYIETDGQPAGDRRVLVVGRISNDTYWGASRVTLVPNELVATTVVLHQRSLADADADGDGIPDEIDDCPGHNDRLPCPLP